MTAPDPDSMHGTSEGNNEGTAGPAPDGQNGHSSAKEHDNGAEALSTAQAGEETDQTGGNAKIVHLTDKLRHMHEVAEVPPPDEMPLHGDVLDVSRPICDVIDDILRLLHGRGILFRRAGLVVVVDKESGAMRPLEPAEFVSWIPDLLDVAVMEGWAGKKGNIPKLCDLTETKAKIILKSRRFLAGLPGIVGVNRVKQPFRRATGKTELLPKGYDPESEIYTLDEVAYDENMDPDEGWKVLEDRLKTWPYSDPNRKAVQLAAMQSFYCRHLYTGKAPAFAWISNMGGSGKSMQAQLAIWPTEGMPASKRFNPWSKDLTKFEQELNSTAYSGRNYLFLDDVPRGKIISNELNAWITMEERTFNPKYGNVDVTFAVRAITCLTGCGIEFGYEIGRRTLVVDLFPAKAAEDRPLPEDAIEVSAKYFRNSKERALILAALWSLVRNWEEGGRKNPGTGILKSFEDWSRVVPPIVAAANFGDCLAPLEQPDVGDTESRDLKLLVAAVVREREGSGNKFWISSADLIATARRTELLKKIFCPIEEKLEELERDRGFSFAKDADGFVTNESKKAQAAGHSNKDEQNAWRAFINRNALVGRVFDVDGRDWKVGDRRKSSARGYDVELVG